MVAFNPPRIGTVNPVYNSAEEFGVYKDDFAMTELDFAMNINDYSRYE